MTDNTTGMHQGRRHVRDENDPQQDLDPIDDELSTIDLVLALAEVRWLLLIAPLLAALLALALSYAVPAKYTAATSFLPPQQAQNSAANALAALGPLAGLVSGGARTPAEQLVALMQSVTLSDRIIQQFNLLAAYEHKLKVEAREQLSKHVSFSVGKKDGLITVEVTDTSPQRAAEMANRYVEELRLATAQIAVTEAQQRRGFFQTLLATTRDRLTQAQLALQSSGFNAGALRTEPRAAAEGYAKLKAEITGGEVRLQILRNSLSDSTPEIRQQLAALDALRNQLAQMEQSGRSGNQADYVGKYREFKYQEALFEVYARQFELARMDESREGTLIQVVDVAQPPERKSSPRRMLIALIAAFAAAVSVIAFAVVRNGWRRAKARPSNAATVALLEATLGRDTAKVSPPAA